MRGIFTGSPRGAGRSYAIDTPPDRSGTMPERLSVDDEDWTEERPVSRHRAGFGDFFRFCWPSLFLAGLCLIFACVGFFVPAKEGPLVGRIVGMVSLVGALAC